MYAKGLSVYGACHIPHAKLNEANKRTFLKYSSTSVFNPYDLTAANALKFMTDLHSIKLQSTVEQEGRRGF